MRVRLGNFQLEPNAILSIPVAASRVIALDCLALRLLEYLAVKEDSFASDDRLPNTAGYRFAIPWAPLCLAKLILIED